MDAMHILRRDPPAAPIFRILSLKLCFLFWGIFYRLLSHQTTYQEKGETFFEEQERQGTEKRLVRQLSRLGYHVELQPIALAG